ncbi:MAG: FKBP-type peptidyl-prolyl cis-trans isomerase, partial [Dehalococcoidia bacterium]
MKRNAFLLLPLSVLVIASVAVACGDGTDEPDPATTVARSTAVATNPSSPGTPIVLTDPTVTASGLRYVDEKVGSGDTPAPSSMVTVHYVGKLASNGTVFDSSVARGTPATFAMNGVIAGFAEALSTMKVGGKRIAYLPANIGYGARGSGPIPPNADLVFEIELIEV